MTTIAFRDGVMAADRYVTGNGTLLAHKTKIVKVGKALVGATGSGAPANSFVRWVESGAKGMPPDMRMVFGDSVYEATGIIIAPGKPARIYTLIEAGWQEAEADPFAAFGSGADTAMGAMAMGATAAQAVEAAMRFDLYSGGGIDTIQFD